MRRKKLGSTDLEISEICLGSMTWGTQNTKNEAFEQIDMALDHNVNIIDTAEMYPVNPLSMETQGNSEKFIGDWVKKTKRRDEVIIATKVSGKGYQAVRKGAPISRKTIRIALENSLQNLSSEYIDLYQLHWPNRGSYMFRQNWNYDPTLQSTEEALDHFLDVLETIKKLISEGKIRHFGLSNESAWGVATWIKLSEKYNLPRVVSIQNEYSLLCRLFDTDLAELSHHENVGLLAFSPLAAGLLSGKYQNDVIPEGSRMSIVPNLGGRVSKNAFNAISCYLAIAKKFNIDPCQMALAFCRSRGFVSSAIIGATKKAQLKNALESTSLKLNDEILQEISDIHKLYPIPY